MNKHILYLIIIILFTGCASKRYAKKGAEFEAVGFYEKAADMYYQSVMKNDKNVEAQVGLKKTGQLTLDKKLGTFLNLYNANNTQDAVYKFIEADKFNTKLDLIGTRLIFPSHYKEYYLEIKDSYLNDKYGEASLLLDEENFIKSETIFNEIIAIDANYYDVKKLRNVAHYEPIYRKATNNYNVEKYRSAYYQFTEVNKAISMYKESDEMAEKSLEKALMTIALIKFKNLSNIKQAEVALSSEIKKNISEIKSPFIKLVDREMTGFLQDEQLFYLEGTVDREVSAKAGQLLGAKYFISGVIENMTRKTSKLIKEKKKGYTQEKITKRVGDEDIVTYKYHKVYYYEIKQSRRAYCRFNYSLISAETSEIILSDAISLSSDDNVHYATFEGDKKDLYPGTWQTMSKASPSDEVFKSKSEYNKLQRLLKAKRQLKSSDILIKDVNDNIAKKVANKIKKYDPEK